jgi:hypothetical protein
VVIRDGETTELLFKQDMIAHRSMWGQYECMHVSPYNVQYPQPG